MSPTNSDTQDLVQDELATLKARADMLNIPYHPSIGVDKLREKVSAALADKPADTPETPETPAAPAEAVAAAETPGQEKQRMKREANELIRIRLTCMNPLKKDWNGEIFTVGNSLIGSITKFIPFNADDGWHVPRILLHVLQDRQCQVFSSKGVGRLIKEFGIEILPALTKDEIHDLAQRQAMSGAID